MQDMREPLCRASWSYSAGLFQWEQAKHDLKRGKVQLRLVDNRADWGRLQRHADEAVRLLNAGTHRLACPFKTLTVGRVEDLGKALVEV